MCPNVDTMSAARSKNRVKSQKNCVFLKKKNEVQLFQTAQQKKTKYDLNFFHIFGRVTGCKQLKKKTLDFSSTVYAAICILKFPKELSFCILGVIYGADICG
jgi:hypothetical protein